MLERKAKAFQITSSRILIKLSKEERYIVQVLHGQGLL